LILPGDSADGRALTRAGFTVGPKGGSSKLGSGARAGFTGGGANGREAPLYGGGGSGGINIQNQGTARSGGAGGNGIVIVDCFI
jgi:hypothetical protein